MPRHTFPPVRNVRLASRHGLGRRFLRFPRPRGGTGSADLSAARRLSTHKAYFLDGLRREVGCTEVQKRVSSWHGDGGGSIPRRG
jgi:hypothetical protein